ncbi:hypothetical protein KB206_06210 [Microvirga sp. STS02]|uniref:hypothetical protein n=1 Tax=Hymenobacter negativus TaxID=2795026 RepID=UPI0018DEADD3|nr:MULTISPECIES: hypothetical protein [Bacteria]MBH8568465.1 hypothetical protein [Hymenobacter negativus]MBR7208200.1 hypothetical protein [Microvirga sp. STS02]
MKRLLLTFANARRGMLLVGLAGALALALPACQADQQRLARLEAVQQQQTQELARLRRQLADKEEEVAELETCVDDLESAVYEDDSTAYDDEPDRPALKQL